MDFLNILRTYPVIAAVRDIEGLRFQDLQQTGILFILSGTIFDLPKITQQARKHQKKVLVDIDLIKGVGKDASGIRFLAQESRVDGIITTRGNLIKSAQKEGLFSIQRIFVLDSESLAGGLNAVEKAEPDAIEVLPGLILPKVMKKIRAATAIPVIAGGLISEKEEVYAILKSGAVGISTTSCQLYKEHREGKPPLS